MKKLLSKLIIVWIPVFFLIQCRFNAIIQPSTAQPGEIITVQLNVGIDIVPETNPHKGVLCILMPNDWAVESAIYTSPIGDGTMAVSESWADSAEACYPADQSAENMHWIGMISDTGYTYEESFEVQITVELQTGYNEGCYDLGYLVTKATPNLICSGVFPQAPLSYPHPISISSTGQTCDTITVERATDWDDLLYRSSGWTGADGIYTIPLSGNETADGNPNERTLILFSDTFIGEVDQNDARQNSTLINNTYAILEGKEPIDEQIDFFWAADQNSQPEAVFIPDTPLANPGEWYWLMDGIAIEDSIHVFGLRLESTGGGAFGFAIVGIAMLSFELGANDSIAEYRQIDTPIYYRNEAEGWEIVFGQAIMPMHNASGNPDSDGYIYIYGPKNISAQKELVAARVLPENFTDFSQWRYWNGSDWGNDIANCAAITNGISQEFSLSPLGNDQYILAFQTGSSVGIRLGESPIGPFGFIQNIYNCPEVQEDPDIFVYNAKAHPHLSNQGELLISYNVNTFDFWDHFSNAGIYRPRFISLALPDDPALFETGEEAFPQVLKLSQNYPNPFNPTTTISYEIDEQSKVSLKIYSTLGQEIKTLLNKVQPTGRYTLKWDGTDDSGRQVSSGIYLYKLEVGEQIAAKKMVFLK